MPDALTHADSIRLYLTGAASDGGTQTDPNASLGNYRSATEVVEVSTSITSPIANITVDFVSAQNGYGNGTLAAPTADTLTWTPPGGTVGAAVTIANGETKILEGGSDKSAYIRVTRTSATALSGTATVAVAYQYNNAIGFDNVSAAEQAAGDIEYRAVMLKNVSASTVKNVKLYIKTLGTQLVSGTAQLSASGAGTVTVASGNFGDWPESGFCRIESSAGALKEIVYYSSRTSTSLTVPSSGRGTLGTSAQAGAATDKIYPVPPLRIAIEAPSSSHIQTIADENTAPTGVSWSTGITADTGVSVGDLAASALYGVWAQAVTIAGATAKATDVLSWRLQFDAA